MATILIIDDYYILRDLLAARLKRAGYDIVEAVDGATGIQMAVQHLPDFILCDYVMPDITGFALLDVLKANHRTEPIPVILLSAIADENIEQQGREHGAIAVFRKPAKFDELLALIEETLGKA